MSDSLGLKAVSRVADTDRVPFIQALAHIAAVDDSVDLDEKRMVEQYADAWDLGADAQGGIQDILRTQTSMSLNDLVSEFSETGTRFLLVQELMRLAHADGTYGDAERREIALIAERMGMTENQFREVEKWVGRGQAWDVAGGEDEPSQDDLESVLDREDDSDHDLSDIETGDSDLSDIDTDVSGEESAGEEGEEEE